MKEWSALHQETGEAFFSADGRTYRCVQERRCLESFCVEGIRITDSVFGHGFGSLYDLYWKARHIKEGKFKMTKELAFAILNCPHVTDDAAVGAAPKAMRRMIECATEMLPEYAQVRGLIEGASEQSSPEGKSESQP
jgi:hypothetical protein